MGCNKCGECYQKLCDFAAKTQCPTLLLVRIFWGWSFVQAGWGKWGQISDGNIANLVGFFSGLGIPFPTANVYLVASVELVGGVLLLVGLFSRLVSIPLMITMLVALFTAHWGDVASWSDLLSQSAFVHFMALLVIFSFGSGGLSLDGWCCKKMCK
jgi:putative oxidoreductase